MRCALINTTSNIVENIIIADPTSDPAPEGYMIVGLSSDSPVSISWVYDPATGSFNDPSG